MLKRMNGFLLNTLFQDSLYSSCNSQYDWNRMVAPSILVREGTRKKRHNYGWDALKSSIERLRLKPKKDVISMSHFP